VQEAARGARKTNGRSRLRDQAHAKYAINIAAAAHSAPMARVSRKESAGLCEAND